MNFIKRFLRISIKIAYVKITKNEENIDTTPVAMIPASKGLYLVISLTLLTELASKILDFWGLAPLV